MANPESGTDAVSGWMSYLQAWPEPLLCIGAVVFLGLVLPAGLLALHLRLSRHFRSAAAAAARASSDTHTAETDARAETLVPASR